MSNSLPEATFIPKKVFRKGVTRGFLYSGPSMKSTFRTGELLYVRPDVLDVKPGDVVVFERNGRNIVHRVLSVGKAGYYTRGDDNSFTDPGLASPDQVVGRVEMGEQLGGITSVRGGRSGLWLARLGRAIRRFEPWLRLMFGWPYRLVKESRIMVRIWKPAISEIRLKNDEGTLVKYIYRKKTVAIWDVNFGRLECCKPFDLVIFRPENQ